MTTREEARLKARLKRFPGEAGFERFPERLQADVARVIHECWRDRMRREGWRHGRVYDKKKKTHDAMVPFDQLDPREQSYNIIALRYAEVVSWAVSEMQYPRGPDRPFRVEEMRVGLRVAMSGDDAPRTVGTISSWDVDPDGELDTVYVRWPDGEVSEHPSYWELERVERSRRARAKR